ncbi:MAG: toll/interleukin-1 receptor domain-containing protein, partial [Planctomycetota bacterium]
EHQFFDVEKFLSARKSDSVSVAYPLNHPTLRAQEADVSNALFDVLVSYASKDREFADELIQRLEKQFGLKVWQDELYGPEGLRQGEPKLEQGIEQSKAFVIAIGSGGTQAFQKEDAEVFLASGDGTMPVVPVLLPEAPEKPEIPPFLVDRVWVDFRDGFTEETLAELVSAITRAKPQHKPPAKLPPELQTFSWWPRFLYQMALVDRQYLSLLSEPKAEAIYHAVHKQIPIAKEESLKQLQEIFASQLRRLPGENQLSEQSSSSLPDSDEESEGEWQPFFAPPRTWVTWIEQFHREEIESACKMLGEEWSEQAFAASRADESV